MFNKTILFTIVTSFGLSLVSGKLYADEQKWKCYANSGCRTPGGAYWGHYGASAIADTRSEATAAARLQAHSNCVGSGRCGYFPHYGQGECVDAGAGNCTAVQVIESGVFE